MKKIVFLIISLVSVEQVIKLLIARFCIDADIELISGVLFFHPVQNTHLLWIANLANYKPPVYVVFALQILVVFVLVLVYRYLMYIFEDGRRYAKITFSFALSGVCCSIIDTIFWGGSLDYIGLFNWFIFDLKDLYLNFFPLSFLIIYAIKYDAMYKHLSEEERRKQAFIYWAKKGFPSKQANSTHIK